MQCTHDGQRSLAALSASLEVKQRVDEAAVSRRRFLGGAAIAMSGMLVPRALRNTPGWPVQSSCLRRRPDGSLVRVPGTAMALYQKAAIIFDGRREVMVLNSMYQGEGDLFGCFGPIPADAQCKPVGWDLFDRLDAATGARSFDAIRQPNATAASKARREEIFNMELLRTIEQIKSWFDRNGFDLSARERQVFDYYLQRKSIFFAALVSYGYPCEGQKVSVWTQPVQSAFASDRVWFPMKSSTTGDGDHAFISFDLLTLGRPQNIPSHYTVTFEGEFELGHRRYHLTRLEARLTMAQMESDLEVPIGARYESL